VSSCGCRIQGLLHVDFRFRLDGVLWNFCVEEFIINSLIKSLQHLKHTPYHHYHHSKHHKAAQTHDIHSQTTWSSLMTMMTSLLVSFHLTYRGSPQKSLIFSSSLEWGTRTGLLVWKFLNCQTQRFFDLSLKSWELCW